MIDRIVKDELLWKAMEIEVKAAKSCIIEVRGLLVVLKELSRNNLTEMKNVFKKKKYNLTETEIKLYFEKEPVTETEIKQAKKQIRKIIND